MSTKTSILALAATAAFAVVAFASTGASAKPPIMGVIIKKPLPPMGVSLPPKPIMGMPITGIPVHPITGIVLHQPGDHDHDHDHDHDWDGPHFGWWHHVHEPVVVDTPVVSAPVVSTPVVSTPAPCTCLTKTYLQDGSLLFKDVCTKESALATPAELKAEAQAN